MKKILFKNLFLILIIMMGGYGLLSAKAAFTSKKNTIHSVIVFENTAHGAGSISSFIQRPSSATANNLQTESTYIEEDECTSFKKIRINHTSTPELFYSHEFGFTLSKRQDFHTKIRCADPPSQTKIYALFEVFRL